MFTRWVARGLAALISAVACCLVASAQGYSVSTFAVPDPPSVSTYAGGISDVGVIVGNYAVPQQFGAFYRGFIRRADGTLHYPITDPNDAGGQDTIPWAVNSSGLIGGFYLGYPDGRMHGFLLDNGTFTTVNEIANGDTFIYALDNNGDFAGAFGPGPGAGTGFISIAGQVTQVNVPGAITTTVTGLALDGSSVGTAGIGKSNYGFLRGPNGKIRVFQVAGAGYPGTYATGINSELQLVVGYYYDVNGHAHGYVYHYPHPLDATAPDSPPSSGLVIEHPDVITIDGSSGTGSTYPEGVNSSGVISGWWQGARHRRNRTYGFIATPVQ